VQYSQCLRLAVLYLEKDQEKALLALERYTRLVDQHPDLFDPASTTALTLRQDCIEQMAQNPGRGDLLRHLHLLINACRQRLEEYDQRGILILPLQRDAPMFSNASGPRQRVKVGAAENTEAEERKYNFQILFLQSHKLLFLCVPNNSPFRNEVMATETMDDWLSALEAEFCPSREPPLEEDLA
jgi:hypothetical protein